MSEWEVVLSKCIDIVLDLMDEEWSEEGRYLLQQLLRELESLIPEPAGEIVRLQPEPRRGIPA